MLYQHKKTGTRVKVVTEWDNGDWFVVEDQDGRIFTVYYTEIEKDCLLYTSDAADEEDSVRG